MVNGVAVVAAICSIAACASPRGFEVSDPFGTRRDLPVPITQRLADVGWMICGDDVIRLPLTLLDAVRHALCYNPRTRQAWTAVEAQAAALGSGKAAYLPSLGAVARVGRVSAESRISGEPELDSSFDGGSNEQSITLNWLLYDFGLRSARLRYERALLEAAAASQNETIQWVLLDTAGAYFGAMQAQAALEAESQAEQAAKESLAVATAKMDAGVGFEADRLQAETALARANLVRIDADARLQSALGTLAVTMGVRPGTRLTLTIPPDSASGDDPMAADQIDNLMGEALQVHPKVVAARARLAAAQDAVSTMLAQGRPTISLIASGDRADSPIDRVADRQQINTSSIGLQLNIPMFEGFAKTYRIREAEAEASGREAELLIAQQEVAQSLWESYVAVRSSSDALRAARLLTQSATRSYDLALGRYGAGVGTIVELLKAQDDLSAARQYALLTRTRSRLSRLQLTTCLGRIDLPTLRGAGSRAQDSIQQ